MSPWPLPFAPGWGLLGTAPGAVYLGLAGLRHVAKRGKGTDELVATWTDLLVCAVVAAGVIRFVLRSAGG
ncbi:hypothetical protein [Mycobacterium sp. DL592]|uniref:hypothetical protein n=1 Tax=Mycobacterium sp. DL592 TaxID=2675524 RepID=UPI00141FC35F|nr:hypothetical protein [Mycobacterium sp. DL592]